MLKSLLLDRIKRKRSSSSMESPADPQKKSPALLALSPARCSTPSRRSPAPSPAPPSHLAQSQPISIPEAPQEILRKRLLGWVDPPPPPPPPSPPAGLPAFVAPP